MMRCLELFLLTFLLSAPLVAQSSFHLEGTAQEMPGDCILLTPDEHYCEGLAYHTTKLNLEGFFEIEFDLFLGDKDAYGADGIVFVIHNDPRGLKAFGTWGECMGYGRWRADFLAGNYIAPSIAIEFDTYQNYRQNDPVHDHVAYLEGGTNYHTEYWHDDDPNFNLEDKRLHNFRFRWEADIQQITVLLDGKIVHQSQRDLVNEVFKGETQVIWGFTASTGRKHNLQYFCLKRWASAD